ncbi:uncharacterized protein N7479_005187 [Penicillium vulpinum]|uniref:uncharacterized protein n=1 Tax=Penicillium vulpinum TaxID=29845 RepID=UPI002549476C|nr:uncharacterized protein N7479_005187 [Penicillium vulpinum]KAJ5958037.1 hypothetical protein N7479_005187 [Penicillium vulpinum]
MNHLTDRPEWYADIFNEEVVADWCKEVFATTPLMGEMTWVWCVKELRDKSLYFRENQHVRVLDTASCAYKSDTTTPTSLDKLFRGPVPSMLEQEQEQDNPDLQSSRIFNLINPLLLSLVYGRSLVLEDGGKVDLHSMFGSYGNATTTPKHFDRWVDSQDLRKEIDTFGHQSTGVMSGHFKSKE